MLVALHGEGDHGARGDRVEHVLGIELVHQGEGVQIAHAAERARGGQRLVLGAAVLGRHAQLLDLHLALAGHGARVAGAAVDQDGVAHRLAADGAGALEGAVAEVARRQDAARLQRHDAARGAELVEPVLGAIVVLAEPDELALGPVLVHGDGRFAAAHDDGLEVLRAHHGAEPPAAVEVLELVHNRRKPHAALAGDAGLEHADSLVAQLRLDPVLDFARKLAPVRRGVAELDLVVLDPEVDGRLRPAADHDPVPTGRAQLGPPPAARLRLAVAAGERRLGRRRVAVGARHRQPVDDAGREDQYVIRPERVRAGRHVAQQDPGGQRAAAQVLAHGRLGELLGAGLARRQIDVQELCGDAGCHRASSSGLLAGRPPRHAGAHRRLGHRGRHGGHHARVEH